jgi:hypothetical protein
MLASIPLQRYYTWLIYRLKTLPRAVPISISMPKLPNINMLPQSFVVRAVTNASQHLLNFLRRPNTLLQFSSLLDYEFLLFEHWANLKTILNRLDLILQLIGDVVFD